MRARGLNALWVCCQVCSASRVVDVSILPDEVMLAWFKPRLRCHECNQTALWYALTRGESFRPTFGFGLSKRTSGLCSSYSWRTERLWW
jgi:hypothetical protein